MFLLSGFLQYLANGTEIIDYPRFKHRGFMIDTSRHYVNVPIILKFLVSKHSCFVRSSCRGFSRVG